ncbi:MAG TPA: hypothetical protein VK918_05220, partial [Pyrinomonadaceae bacterium]|nr:hypothetical protein [Pyrinomonadaceae bacterium]
VRVVEGTEVKRVPADNPKLSAAVAAQLGDIAVGDKLMVTGVFPADRSHLPARAIYLMAQSDIAKKQAADAQKWATRGISGRVTAVDAAAKQITLEVRGLTGATSVAITPKDNAVFRRYAPNSIEFSKAVVTDISNIREGDMLRALGDRSADGASFTAEEVISGAFRTVAGTIKAIDVENKEVTITDLATEQDVVVSLGSAMLMKRFPAEMAQRLAMMGAANGAGGAPQGGRPGGAAPAGGGQRGPGNGMGARGGIDDMLVRFPDVTASELKTGEMIAVSSSRTDDPTRITAIKLLAGVEPFIRAAQMSGAAQRGGRGGTGNFTIPGLDDFEMPGM